MKRPLILLQWLLILGVAAGIVYSLVKPQPPPRYNPATWKSWQGFFALSYTGVVRSQEPDYVTPDLLGRQLRALREAGYQTIKLKDALEYLQGRAPLPDKALILLFEGDRKDCFLWATPLLEQNGLLANMCVPTKLTRSWSNFFLNEGEIKKVCGHTHWDLVSMGHRAIDQIVLDRMGNQGHFLSHRKWLGEANEDDEIFRQRVLGDYLQAAEILQQACGRPVLAYLYPYSDTGQGFGADPLAADINRQGLAAHHGLAFTRAGDPFNGPQGDPYSLTRLRVHGDWDGSRLVAELEKYASRQQPLKGLGGRDLWQFSGDSQMGADGIQLPDGGCAWLRGTDNWEDLEVTATVRLKPPARTVVYARYGGPQAYVRLTLNDQEVILQERLGGTMQTLARQALAGSLGESPVLRLRVKGNRAWAWVNNLPVVQAAPLTHFTLLGRVGVGAQEASVLLTDFAAAPLSDTFILADSYRSLSPTLQEQAGTILPSWFETHRAPEIGGPLRSDLLAAAAGGVETIPGVAHQIPLNEAAAEAWAKDLATALAAGEYKSLVTTLAVAGADHKLAAALEKHGFRILLRMTPQQALQLSPGSPGLEKKLVLIDGPEGEARKALDHLLHFIPARRLIVRLDSPGLTPVGVRFALSDKPPQGRDSQ